MDMSKIDSSLIRQKQIDACKSGIREANDVLESLYSEMTRRQTEEPGRDGGTRDGTGERYLRAMSEMSSRLSALPVSGRHKTKLDGFLFGEFLDAVTQEWFTRGYENGLRRMGEITGYGLDGGGDLRDRDGEVVEKAQDSRTPKGWPGWKQSERTAAAKSNMEAFFYDTINNGLLLERALSLAEDYATQTASDAAESVTAYVRGESGEGPRKCRYVIESVLRTFAKEMHGDAPEGGYFVKNMLHLIDRYVGLVTTEGVAVNKDSLA
jgi:hypothetical protein